MKVVDIFPHSGKANKIFPDSGKSSKNGGKMFPDSEKEDKMLEGNDIEIIDEFTFYDLLNE